LSPEYALNLNEELDPLGLCYVELIALLFRALLLFSVLLGEAHASSASAVPVRDLLNRRVPNLSPYIELALLPSNTSSNGHFEVMNSTSSQNVSIRGSDPNSFAAGVHWYLRYVAGRHIAWNADNLDTIPLPPPRPQKLIQQESAATWRYAWNVCTHGYTMVWWKWPRWELELDFMALSGVNLPLRVTSLPPLAAHGQRIR
jgi:alpha-N-acetylglucosaminidase